jgi:branched-chain amino acid transport system permease protein
MPVIRDMSIVTRTNEASRRTANISNWSKLALLALLLVVPVIASNFITFQMTMLLVYAIALVALNILTGFTGQFSLGQNAFFAIGGYAAVIVVEHFHLNYLIGIPVAAVAASVAGVLFAFPALRLKGVYLALATFALGTAVPQLLKLDLIEDWTGGVQGMMIEKPATPLDLPLSQDTYLYYLTLLVGFGVYVLSCNLLRSKTGRAMLAIRENETAAAAMGVDVAFYKTVAFALSAAFTGVAGALGAIVIQFVAPDGYTIQLAVAMFLGLVVGGVGWLPGALVGAAFIVFVPNFAESISKGLSGAVFGVIILMVIFLFPRGALQISEMLVRPEEDEA